MTTLDLKHIPYQVNSGEIQISEKHIKFDTTYVLISPRTGNRKIFYFTHSTGNEFDPNTKWIYKSDDDVILAVVNDELQTKRNAAAYLNAKLRR